MTLYNSIDNLKTDDEKNINIARITIIGYYNMDEPKENRFLPISENDEDSQSTKSLTMANPRKHTIVRGRKKDKRFITFYETNYGNAYCMNAKTNYPYDVKYGSRDEDKLFSVILSTGETGKTPPILFYNSPEEYERHFGEKVSNETKQRWHKKQLGYRISLMK